MAGVRLVVAEREMPHQNEACGKIVDLINPELAGSKEVSLATVLVEPGRRSMAHYHRRTEEIYYIIAGLGSIRIDDREYDVSPGSAIYIPVMKVHEIWNTGTAVLKFVSFDSPVFDPNDFILADGHS